MRAVNAPLDGVRVVDLTTTFLGPYTTMLMARMGADVIKVETRDGDVLRDVGTGRHPGMGPIFLTANHGKRSIALDLKSPGGRAAMRRLVAGADAFVTNMRPDAVERLGLGPDELTAADGRLVYVALRGFGAEGPYRDRAAYDDVIQAASGLAAVQGGDGDPAYVRSVVADKAVAVMGLAAVNAALFARERTGRGGFVEVPMFESMVSFLMLEQQNARVLDPDGACGYSRTASPNRRPYRTADGFLGVMVYTDKQWLSFFELIGRPELAHTPRYSTITGRTEHIDELYGLVAEALPARTNAEWVAAMEPLGIPVQPVLSPDDLLADEHLRAVELFEQVAHPSEGTLTLPRLPMSFDGEHAAPVRGAPRLGEHGADVLREAGLDDAEIEHLRADGVLS
ncbi:crotonobetainyl-CoA:carnitine CoA-transferase CaiB-like acyl-CoA transferase [Pseudonocardia sediminis]|uniref:Crotonobetainyl-CoA:carnitine CoA-transferase CaiB-like acyl-CoA transferase n=1 Tax=Pseudonocardia sediminis TaxID=1397368 RepID=A0A4Q7UWV2_PSEST|nr:crotonobetainyl-CoA:carnitine CoA-transferase CaiB-like acyl-CoA transferase [Pseudonocardia sediminis]